MVETILQRLVQIGTVTAINSEQRTVRVKFKDTGLISDWLHVLQRSNNVTIRPGGEDEHIHGIDIAYWLPKINDNVVVLYLPIFNSDGFVLGGV